MRDAPNGSLTRSALIAHHSAALGKPEYLM
jgi:hypothetical protein